MRISPIHETLPPTPEPIQPQGRIWSLKNLARLLAPEKVRPQGPEPVTERALELGRFAAAHLDLKRVRCAEILLRESEVDLAVEDIKETKYTGPKDYCAPEPHAILKLYGRDYNSMERTGPTNRFMCTFGVYNLADGGRLAQAVPFEWESPCHGYEVTGRDVSLVELFRHHRRTGWDTIHELAEQNYARINLGTIEDGSFTHNRPTNEWAFGANLIPLLDGLGAAAAEGALNIDLHQGSIREY